MKIPANAMALTTILMGCGAATGAVEPAAPAASEETPMSTTEDTSATEDTPATTIRLEAGPAKCTKERCFPEDPCCHSCTHVSWTVVGTDSAIEAKIEPGVEPLPICELDGCGECPYELEAEGEEQDGVLRVTAWSRAEK